MKRRRLLLAGLPWLASPMRGQPALPRVGALTPWQAPDPRIPTFGALEVAAARRATGSLPIVGVYLDGPGLLGKQMELLRTAVPALQRLAVIGVKGINMSSFRWPQWPAGSCS